MSEPVETRTPQDHLRDTVPLRFQNLYKRALSGSRPSAIKAMCLECQVWEDGAVAAVRSCASTACPLHKVRPYQIKGEEEEPDGETVEGNGWIEDVLEFESGEVLWRGPYIFSHLHAIGESFVHNSTTYTVRAVRVDHAKKIVTYDVSIGDDTRTPEEILADLLKEDEKKEAQRALQAKRVENLKRARAARGRG